jgi:SAM-dependent methyltransferase
MNTIEPGVDRQRRNALRRWFEGIPGAKVAQSEQAGLARVLPDLFGYHLIQLGRLNISALSASRISHKMIALIDLSESGDESLVEPSVGSGVQPGVQPRVQPDVETIVKPPVVPTQAGVLTTETERGPAVVGSTPSLACSAESLPISAESVDVALLPHVLEFEDNPHQVLREVERILIGEGHVVIVGFNPLSFFGIWRAALWWKENPPWCGRFLSVARLKDWLKLLGFDIVSTQFLFYRPPLRHAKLLAKIEPLEKFAAFCWRYFGGVYVLVGKKRIESLTPIKAQWTQRRHLISAGLTEPTTRAGSSQLNGSKASR